MLKYLVCFCAFGSLVPAATIEAVVTSKAGVVKDLAAKDFKVWEDNKEQIVTGATASSAGKHAIVLLFDNTTISVSRQGDIRGYVSSFIDANANPNLYMEVATFRTAIEILQPFTSDPALLKASLAGTAASTIVGSTQPGGATTTSRALGQGSLGDTQAGSDSAMKSQALMENLRAMADNLASIRGRKAILFFTGGHEFSQDATSQVDNAIEAANKANVAIYGISDNVSYAKTFADATGGTAIRVTQSMPSALKEILQEQDQYYSVTFDSAAGAAPGSCHQLRMKVERDGADVRTRKSYCTANTASRSLDSQLSGTANGGLNASLQAPWFYGDGGNARVQVVLDAPSSGVKFQKVKGKVRGELNVAGAAYGADGSIAARFSESVPLEFADQKQADAWLKQPFHYENQLIVPPGKYTVKAVLSPAADVFGKAVTEVTVAPGDPQKLRVGGIALSRALVKASGDMGALPADMVEGPSPMLAGGGRLVPTAQTRFQKTERMLFYMEILDPSLAGKTPGGVSMQFKVLERASGAVKSDSGVASLAGYIKPGNPLIAAASTAPTAQLTPGAYRLEVTVSHTSGPDTVTRSVDFDIQ